MQTDKKIFSVFLHTLVWLIIVYCMKGCYSLFYFFKLSYHCYGFMSHIRYFQQSTCHKPNSKHWFTTSFLQPLPYLVTPQVAENCQLTSRFFCWCSNSSKFVTNNSDYIRCLLYNLPCCLCQLKLNQNRLNRDWPFFLFFKPGVDASHVDFVPTCAKVKTQWTMYVVIYDV